MKTEPSPQSTRAGSAGGTRLGRAGCREARAGGAGAGGRERRALLVLAVLAAQGAAARVAERRWRRRGAGGGGGAILTCSARAVGCGAAAGDARRRFQKGWNRRSSCNEGDCLRSGIIKDEKHRQGGGV
jgi:hypothetical protein